MHRKNNHNTSTEYYIFIGGKPTEINKFIYSEKVYSKKKAIKRAKKLGRLFNSTVIVEEWHYTFSEPGSLLNGFTKGQVFYFSVPYTKEAA